MPRPKTPFLVRCINASDMQGWLTPDREYTVVKVYGSDPLSEIVMFTIIDDKNTLGNYYSTRFEYIKDAFELLVDEVMRAVNTLRIFDAGPEKNAFDILVAGLKKVGVETYIGEPPEQPTQEEMNVLPEKEQGNEKTF